MKIYLSGTLDDYRVRTPDMIPETLRNLGHEVMSHWHIPGHVETMEENYMDLDCSDAVLAVQKAGHRHQGMHAEMGYAIGTGKRVYLLGNLHDVNLMVRHPFVTEIMELNEIPV